MTVNHPHSEAVVYCGDVHDEECLLPDGHDGPHRGGCDDYDPNYKLHGCELPTGHDGPHIDFLGVEWTETLTRLCPSVSEDGWKCTLHDGHFPARHRNPAGDEWTDQIYERSGPRKSAPIITDSGRTCDQAHPETGAWCHRGGDHGVHRDTNGDEWRTAAAAYEDQLEQRVAELLPDADNTARFELLDVMDPDDLRLSLAFIVGLYPQVFDFALVRDRRLVERLQDRLDHQHDDDPEPYCTTCGAKAGIFIAHGDAWLHYTGEGTVASPVELFDAGHAPVIAWREAGAL